MAVSVPAILISNASVHTQYAERVEAIALQPTNINFSLLFSANAQVASGLGSAGSRLHQHFLMPVLAEYGVQSYVLR